MLILEEMGSPNLKVCLTSLEQSLLVANGSAASTRNYTDTLLLETTLAPFDTPSARRGKCCFYGF